MKQSALTHQFVHYIPADLAEGILYVSLTYNTAVHRCACGCGEQGRHPHHPSRLAALLRRRGSITHPVDRELGLPCRSHTGSTAALSAGPAHGLPARSPPDGQGMITDEHAISRSGHPGPAARPHPMETRGNAPAGSGACEPYSPTLPYDALPGETKTLAAASRDARRGSEYLERVRYPPAGSQPGFHPLHTGCIRRRTGQFSPVADTRHLDLPWARGRC